MKVYKGYDIIYSENENGYYTQDFNNSKQPVSRLYEDFEELKNDIDKGKIVFEKIKTFVIDGEETEWSATEVDWVKINQLKRKEEEIIFYLGNYLAEEDNEAYALFGKGSKKGYLKIYCIRIS